MSEVEGSGNALVLLSRASVSIAPRPKHVRSPRRKALSTSTTVAVAGPAASGPRLRAACPFARLAPAAAACPVTGARAPRPPVIVLVGSNGNDEPDDLNDSDESSEDGIGKVCDGDCACADMEVHETRPIAAPESRAESSAPVESQPSSGGDTPVTGVTADSPVSHDAAVSATAAVIAASETNDVPSDALALVVPQRRRCPWWARALRYAARSCAKQVLIRSLKPVLRNSVRVVLHVMRNVQGKGSGSGGCPVVHAIVKPGM